MDDEAFFLARYKAAAADIVAALPDASPYFAPTFAPGDPLRREIIRFVTEGGKRLRPALSLCVARSFGHDDAMVHLALEAFHKHILAHDDIIDRDEVRYNAPTVHAKMAGLCPVPAERAHFGNSLAIVAGNLMLAAANKIIAESDLPADVKNSLAALLVQATEEVTWGWYDQFLMDYLPLDSPELSLERIETSTVWVTGKYSTKLPLAFGYAVAGQPLPAGLAALADTLGKLFQTGDDILGLFGDQVVTGKSNSGDITQGKKTVPMWLAYQAASDVDKAVLRQCVGNKTCTPQQIEQVRRIIRDSGGLDHAQKMMQTYRKDCLAQLAALDVSPDVRRLLTGMVAFLERRKK